MTVEPEEAKERLAELARLAEDGDANAATWYLFDVAARVDQLLRTERLGREEALRILEPIGDYIKWQEKA